MLSFDLVDVDIMTLMNLSWLHMLAAIITCIPYRLLYGWT